jgi:hypothetical protein
MSDDPQRNDAGSFIARHWDDFAYIVAALMVARGSGLFHPGAYWIALGVAVFVFLYLAAVGQSPHGRSSPSDGQPGEPAGESSPLAE